MKTDMVKNIFKDLPSATMEEVFETIVDKKGVRIERITSLGQATPKGEWLKDKKNEWVILIKGKAKLTFRDTKKVVTMNPGDHLFIASGVSHRVDWTSPKEKSVWVAVIF